MAADSRLTLVFPLPSPKDSKSDDLKQEEPKTRTVHLVSVPQSDATNKLFLAQNRIGISTAGDALVKGVPISGVIESFILRCQRMQLQKAQRICSSNILERLIRSYKHGFTWPVTERAKTENRSMIYGF